MVKTGEREGVISLIRRFALQIGPWEKRPLADAIFWVKLIVSFALGLLFGAFQLTGILGNIIFILCCPLGFHLYVINRLEVDVETLLGSPSAVAVEGMLHSYAAFLLTWAGITTLWASLN
jgi:hypothetical protein